MRSESTGFLVPLLYSEFVGAVPARADFEALVRRIEWHAAVIQVSEILAISWQVGIEDPVHQRALVVEMAKHLLYFPAIVSKLQGATHRRLFTRESLLAVLRVAVVEKSVGDSNTSDYSDAFIKAVLAANELLSLEITTSQPTGTASDLLPSELRSAIMHLENPHDLLARSDAFFAWSKTPKARASSNVLPVEEDLCRFTGLTPLEYAAGAYFVLSHYAGMKT